MKIHKFIYTISKVCNINFLKWNTEHTSKRNQFDADVLGTGFDPKSYHYSKSRTCSFQLNVFVFYLQGHDNSVQKLGRCFNKFSKFIGVCSSLKGGKKTTTTTNYRDRICSKHMNGIHDRQHTWLHRFRFVKLTKLNQTCVCVCECICFDVFHYYVALCTEKKMTP